MGCSTHPGDVASEEGAKVGEAAEATSEEFVERDAGEVTVNNCFLVATSKCNLFL